MNDEKGISQKENEQELKPTKCPIFYGKNENGGNTNTITLNKPTDLSAEEVYAKVICELTGTSGKELAEDIIWGGYLAITNEENQQEKKNVIAQSLWEQKPKDAHEARLCAQATALYSQGMRYMHRSERENMIPQCEYYMKNAIKLLRLHNETIEALNKYRRGGEQRVVVQHVQVNGGGKAVVGGVFEGGGVKEKDSEVGHGHTADL